MKIYLDKKQVKSLVEAIENLEKKIDRVIKLKGNIFADADLGIALDCTRMLSQSLLNSINQKVCGYVEEETNGKLIEAIKLLERWDDYPIHPGDALKLMNDNKKFLGLPPHALKIKFPKKHRNNPQ